MGANKFKWLKKKLIFDQIDLIAENFKTLKSENFDDIGSLLIKLIV